MPGYSFRKGQVAVSCKGDDFDRLIVIDRRQGTYFETMETRTLGYKFTHLSRGTCKKREGF